MNEVNTLERNVGYVNALVRNKPGEFDLFELTKHVRLKHSTDNPLGLKDAKDAIAEAERRNLVQPRNKGHLYGDAQFYYPLG